MSSVFCLVDAQSADFFLSLARYPRHGNVRAIPQCETRRERRSAGPPGHGGREQARSARHTLVSCRHGIDRPRRAVAPAEARYVDQYVGALGTGAPSSVWFPHDTDATRQSRGVRRTHVESAVCGLETGEVHVMIGLITATLVIIN